MKKVSILICAVLMSISASFAQVMDKAGVKNTLSTSFGKPYASGTSGYSDDDLKFYGFIDTVQARVDVKKLTVDAMLNWGALCEADTTVGKLNDDFTVSNTDITPFWYTNHGKTGSWWTDGTAESYYVNFIYHVNNYWDLGMGTRLGWKVGPAPSYNGNLWEPFAHVVQGGLKDAKPGDADVAGYTYYANSYTQNYNQKSGSLAKGALAARFMYKDFLEIGAAVPNGATTDDPMINAGFKIHPADFLTISAGADSIFYNTGNLYGGVTLGFKPFALDAWIGVDYKKSNKENGGRWGTGAALTFNFSRIGLMLRPEAGATFYTYSDYTFAAYGGIRVNWDINKKFTFGGWSSLAFGAKDKTWEDQDATKDYWGGSIFDVRPDFTWHFNDHHSFTAYLDFQHKENFAKQTVNTWATGVYWTVQ